jgi:hypothetical protein
MRFLYFDFMEGIPFQKILPPLVLQIWPIGSNTSWIEFWLVD